MLTPITLGASECPSLARSLSAERDLELVIGELFVTKKEIVKTISEEIGLTQLKTKEIVQKTFDAIVETLVEDHRIELRNFGVFEVKRRAARKARNPPINPIVADAAAEQPTVAILFRFHQRDVAVNTALPR